MLQQEVSETYAAVHQQSSIHCVEILTLLHVDIIDVIVEHPRWFAFLGCLQVMYDEWVSTQQCQDSNVEQHGMAKAV